MIQARRDHCWGAAQNWLGRPQERGAGAREKGLALPGHADGGQLTWAAVRARGRGVERAQLPVLPLERERILPRSLAVHTKAGNQVARGSEEGVSVEGQGEGVKWLENRHMHGGEPHRAVRSTPHLWAVALSLKPESS